MKKNRFLKKAEAALDFSEGILENLPNITLYGKGRIEIDNFKGLLDFTKESVKLNTTDSILIIIGSDLTILFMTDETICICGEIKSIGFE